VILRSDFRAKASSDGETDSMYDASIKIQRAFSEKEFPQDKLVGEFLNAYLEIT